MPPRDTYQTVNAADYVPATATATIANTVAMAADTAVTNITDHTEARITALEDVITYIGTDLNTVTGTTTAVDNTWMPWTTQVEQIRATEPITFTWRDKKEDRIRALEINTEEIKEKFDAILKKLDQVLGDKLVISDLDLARLLGLGEV